MIKEYSIGGMTCAACSASVERAVRRVQGVDAASVNLSTERLTVRSEMQAWDVQSPETAGRRRATPGRERAIGAKQCRTQNCDGAKRAAI